MRPKSERRLPTEGNYETHVRFKQPPLRKSFEAVENRHGVGSLPDRYGKTFDEA